jgi:hypothetical protein
VLCDNEQAHSKISQNETAIIAQLNERLPRGDDILEQLAPVVGDTALVDLAILVLELQDRVLDLEGRLQDL